MLLFTFVLLFRFELTFVLSLALVPGQGQLPAPLCVPDIVVPELTPLLAPPLTPVLAFMLLLMFVFAFMFVLLLVSAPALPALDGLALGLAARLLSLPPPSPPWVWPVF